MSIQAPSLPTDTTLQPLGQEVEPTLVSLLESSCRRFAQRPAYHNLGTTLTYGELERIGVPDERSGQAVAIFVVLRPGGTAPHRKRVAGVLPRAADGLQTAEAGGISHFPAQNQRWQGLAARVEGRLISGG